MAAATLLGYRWSTYLMLTLAEDAAMLALMFC